MVIDLKKSNAIAIEILPQKSNAIVEIIIIKFLNKFSIFLNIDLLIIYLFFILKVAVPEI